MTYREDPKDKHRIIVSIKKSNSVMPLYSNVVEVSATPQIVQIDYGYIAPAALSMLWNVQGKDDPHTYNMDVPHLSRMVLSLEDARQLVSLLNEALEGAEQDTP